MSQIEGLKVIYANTHRINNPDDPSYPYKLYANFRPPEFMQVAFVMLHGGSEEVVVRAMTREAIDECIRQNEWRDHPRLRRLVLTLPDGTEELLAGKARP